MRIVFMGTPGPSASTLSALAASQHQVVAAYTRPDAVRKRGRQLEPSPVKAMAAGLGIPVETPRSFYAKTPDGLPLLDTHEQRVVDAAELARLYAYQPDIVVVTAYGMILPQKVLDLPRFGCVNIHFSLLPRWRGAAPVQRAILAGDEQVGVTIMQVTADLDSGPYCLQRALAVGEHGSDKLTDQLMELGQDALLESLEVIAAGTVCWTEQDDSLVTYADKIRKGELFLDPQLDALTNIRRVRASSGSAPARCRIADRNVAVTGAVDLSFLRGARESTDADVADLQIASGAVRVLGNKRLLLGAADGAIEVIRLKPEGKSEMDAAAFILGIPALRAGAGQGAVKWQAL